MSVKQSGRQHAKRLFRIRNRFDPRLSLEKLDILETLSDEDIDTCTDLIRLHSALCFIRAFPDSLEHFRAACTQLAHFELRVQRLPAALHAELWDTGIAGTTVHYPFSFEVATWMANQPAGIVAIDWEDVVDEPRLDELLEPLLLPAEIDYFDSGYVSAREWIESAATNTDGSDFDWLMMQLGDRRRRNFWAQLYNAVELPLAWNLAGNHLSRTHNALPVRRVAARKNGMRRPARPARRQISQPLEVIEMLTPRRARRLIDAAMASLAARHRETYHFNYANPKEVYLADVGEGVAIAVFGLRHEHRFPLECTMGYLILSNGVPIGYGGSSLVFRQANTGINIFDEYRGSEAGFLWTQVLRVYHQLTGCTRYIANPYQIGSGNDEALRSGAFWFYYRLGFRPVLKEIRELARRESRRMRGDGQYRVDLSTLRRLSSCDVHLALPDARDSEYFDESWIETSSMLATRVLAAAGGRRDDAAGRVVAELLRELGIRSIKNWSRAERDGLRRLAPVVAAAGPAAWQDDEKRAARELLRAKGGDREANYARLLGRHGRFRAALGAACRRAE